MTPEQYIEDVQRTKSDRFDIQSLPGWQVFTVLAGAANLGAAVDKLKKGVFYGKEIDLGITSDDVDRQLLAVPFRTDHLDPDIFHGIVGMFTEAAELMEALAKSMVTGEPLDEVNLVEELGDGNWYQAIVMKKLGVSHGEIWDKNINKLRVRFPEKFDIDRVLDRDLEAERKVLSE